MSKHIVENGYELMILDTAYQIQYGDPKPVYLSDCMIERKKIIFLSNEEYEDSEKQDLRIGIVKAFICESGFLLHNNQLPFRKNDLDSFFFWLVTNAPKIVSIYNILGIDD